MHFCAGVGSLVPLPGTSFAITAAEVISFLFPSVPESLTSAALARSRYPQLPLIIEVENLDELRQALARKRWDTESRAHLQESLTTLDQALSASMVRD